MSTFIRLSADRLEADDADIKTLKVKKYNNLPIASSNEAGIVKIDKNSFDIDDNGNLTIKMDKNILEHLNNTDIHKNKSEIDIINSMEKHVKSFEKHLTAEDKKKLKISFTDIEEVKAKLKKIEQSEQENITREFIKEIENHLNDTEKHVLLSDIERVSKDINNKLSLTDNKTPGLLGINNDGFVIVSDIQIDFLEKILKGVNNNIIELLDGKSDNGHQHEDAYTPLNHSKDDNIHVSKSWKENIESKLEFLGRENNELKEEIQNLKEKNTLDDLRGEFNE